ncbi:MAG: Stage 0 sporulation A-like protein [Oscillospiraceae bacterium]|jgi:two-component system, response regulator YesN
MYSVMIVDDEPLMVKYLKNNIKRIAPEWQVSGIALDGLQAVELLQRQSFELVITDIRMPEMDGLELAKYISEIYPETKVIIISGFDDFDYAQRAIRCGVSDYLLKPLSDESVANTLKKISDRFRADQTKLFSEGILAKAEKATDEQLLSEFLRSAIQQEADFNLQALYSIMVTRQIGMLHQPYFCVAIVGVDSAVLLTSEKSYQQISSCQMRLNQICKETCKNNPNSASCYCDGGNTAVLFCCEKKESLIQQVKIFYIQIKTIMEQNHCVPILSAYGTIEEDILCIRNSYQNAEQSFLIASAHEPILSSDERSKKDKLIRNFAKLVSSVYSDFISHNDSRIHAALTDFFQSLPTNEDPLTPLRFGLHVLSWISHQSKIKKNRLEKAFQELAKHLKNNAHKLNKKETADAFYEAILALNKDEKFQLSDDNSQLVNKAKHYIAAHYSEPISLTLIAEKLGVSSSYLSDLFHREVGEPYSKFVTRIRMEQAIMKMKADPYKKIYTVAAEVGFINVKHFNAVFKKFYHVTPTEYFRTLT